MPRDNDESEFHHDGRPREVPPEYELRHGFPKDDVRSYRPPLPYNKRYWPGNRETIQAPGTKTW